MARHHLMVHLNLMKVPPYIITNLKYTADNQCQIKILHPTKLIIIIKWKEFETNERTECEPQSPEVWSNLGHSAQEENLEKVGVSKMLSNKLYKIGN